MNLLLASCGGVEIRIEPESIHDFLKLEEPHGGVTTGAHCPGRTAFAEEEEANGFLLGTGRD